MNYSRKAENQPGKCQGSALQTSTSGMMEDGNGEEKTFLLRYWTTSSSSVGWNLKPGGSLKTPFLARLVLSMDTNRGDRREEEEESAV